MKTATNGAVCWKWNNYKDVKMKITYRCTVLLYLYFCVSFGIGGDMTQNDFFGTEGTA